MTATSLNAELSKLGVTDATVTKEATTVDVIEKPFSAATVALPPSLLLLVLATSTSMMRS